MPFEFSTLENIKKQKITCCFLKIRKIIVSLPKLCQHLINIQYNRPKIDITSFA